MIKRLFFIIAISLSLAVSQVYAEQSKSFGDYTIHFSAFTTDILTPEVAKAYRIPRSKNRALLNISVLKKVMNTAGSPVKAKIKASATNLNSQLRDLDVRELDDKSGAIYYIAETTVDNEEVLKYSITVLPEGENENFTFDFQQQFFTR